MEDLPIPTADPFLRQFLAQYDAPAYVRRARRVQEAYEYLLARCGRQHDEWLQMVRLRLGRLHSLAGEWAALDPGVADSEQIEILRQLYDQLQPRLRLPIPPTCSQRVLRHSLGELIESVMHFNERWLRYLRAVDLKEVNELREDYNRYFVLEKECAFRSARLARQGFRSLSPLTSEEVFTLFPLLPVPVPVAQSDS
jgi:hypothetical protein